MFLARPSRPEDIRRIKYLLAEIENLRVVLKSADQKALEADDISKHLKLELQNYKNVYDIFGPPK